MFIVNNIANVSQGCSLLIGKLEGDSPSIFMRIFIPSLINRLWFRFCGGNLVHLFHKGIFRI